MLPGTNAKSRRPLNLPELSTSSSRCTTASNRASIRGRSARSRSSSTARKARTKRETAIHFDYAHKKSTLDEKNLKTGETKHVENDLAACATDVITGFYYLQSLPLQLGERYEFPISDGKTTIVRAAWTSARKSKCQPETFSTVQVTAEAISGRCNPRARCGVVFGGFRPHAGADARQTGMGNAAVSAATDREVNRAVGLEHFSICCRGNLERGGHGVKACGKTTVRPGFGKARLQSCRYVVEKYIRALAPEVSLFALLSTFSAASSAVPPYGLQRCQALAAEGAHSTQLRGMLWTSWEISSSTRQRNPRQPTAAGSAR